MDPERLQRRFLSLFVSELLDVARSMEGDLLSLERAEGVERDGLLNALFRGAHTLKGAAGSVGLGALADFCHLLEDLLAVTREGRGELGQAQVELLLESCDVLVGVGRRMQAGEELDPTAWADMAERLTSSAEATPVESPEPPAPRARLPEREQPAALRSFSPAGGVSSQLLAAHEALAVRVTPVQLRRLQVQAGELRQQLGSLGEITTGLQGLEALLTTWRSEWGPAGRSYEVPRGATSLDDSAGGVARGRPGVGSQLGVLLKELGRLRSQLTEEDRRLRLAATQLEDRVHELSLISFGEVCESFVRLVRDLSRSQEKQGELRIEGAEVRVDRAIADGLQGPLRHLLRNAVDHGLESPAAREAAGKSARGAVVLSARVHGERVVIECADDGRGVDEEALRAELKRGGGEALDLREILFRPGFTTTTTVTGVSGRGVGLDAVKTGVEALQGTVAVTSTAGAGTRFSLSVPVTLSRVPALLLRAGGQTWAVLLTSLVRLLDLAEHSPQTVAGRLQVSLADGRVPVVSLARVLGIPPQDDVDAQLVVLAAGLGRVAFSVEACLDQREIVVKGLGQRLAGLPLVLGGTLLADGSVALVLDAAGLVRAGSEGRGTIPERAGSDPADRSPRVVIADDSLTTRSLWRLILEAQGFRVRLAADGQEALELLEAEGADALVSDVEMPRLDGFALTAALRASPVFAELPVILVTSLAREEERLRGAQCGADAYLLKSHFEQDELLATLSRLLGRTP